MLERLCGQEADAPGPLRCKSVYVHTDFINPAQNELRVGRAVVRAAPNPPNLNVVCLPIVSGARGALGGFSGAMGVLGGL